MIIDFHVHVGTLEHWNPRVVSSWFEPFGLSPNLLEVSPTHLLQEMDAAGVDKAVVLAFDCRRHMGVHVPNDYVGELCRAHPDRFVPFGSFDPIDYASPDALLRAREEWGIAGVKLSPTYQDVDPAHPRFLQFLALCAELGLPVLIHHGSTGNSFARTKYQQAWQLDEMLMAVPGLTLVVAHMGMPSQHEVLTLMIKHQRLYADISARTLLSFGGGVPQLRQDILRAIEYGVADRLLWGTDFPFTSPSEALSDVRSLIGFTEPGRPVITPEVVEAMLGGNALRILPESVSAGKGRAHE